MKIDWDCETTNIFRPDVHLSRQKSVEPVPNQFLHHKFRKRIKPASANVVVLAPVSAFRTTRDQFVFVQIHVRRCRKIQESEISL